MRILHASFRRMIYASRAARERKTSFAGFLRESLRSASKDSISTGLQSNHISRLQHIVAGRINLDDRTFSGPANPDVHPLNRPEVPELDDLAVKDAAPRGNDPTCHVA
jgi:hypothetical protein